MTDSKWITAESFMSDFFSDINVNDSEYIYYDVLGKISVALVEYRMKRGLSQEGLAKLLGVTQAMISKYESGEYNISLKSVVDLLSKLGIPFELNIGRREDNGILPQTANHYHAGENVSSAAMIDKYAEYANAA